MTPAEEQQLVARYRELHAHAKEVGQEWQNAQKHAKTLPLLARTVVLLACEEYARVIVRIVTEMASIEDKIPYEIGLVSIELKGSA